MRDIFARWNGGERDFDPSLFDPEIRIHSSLTGQVYEREEGVRIWAAEIDEQFAEWDLVIDEVRDLSDELVLVVGEIRMKGQKSSVELRQPASWLAELKVGRLSRLRNFLSREAAAEFASGSA